MRGVDKGAPVLSRGKMPTNRQQDLLTVIQGNREAKPVYPKLEHGTNEVRAGRFGGFGIFGVLRVRGCWWCIGNLRSLFLSFVV